MERIKYSLYNIIGTTSLTITLPFTLDVKLPASRADRLFLIAFEAQYREGTSLDEDNRGARTLTDDLKEEGYIYMREAFIMDRSASESAEEKKRVIIEAEERYVFRIPLVKMEFKRSIE